MQEGVDFYFNAQGLMVLTEIYLVRRGFCCGNGCTHCPYDDNEELRPEFAELAQKLKSGETPDISWRVSRNAN